MLGLTFAVLTVFSGSLATAIVVHVIVDLAYGRVMRAAVALASASVSSETGKSR